MENNFIELLETVEELKAYLKERDLLREKRKKLETQAKEFCSGVIQKYQAEEKKFNEIIKKAEIENEDQMAQIIELTKKQVVEGDNFEELQKLEKLKVDVATNPLKINGLQQLKSNIVITQEDLMKADDYIEKGCRLSDKIITNARKILELLAKIKHNSGVSCPAMFDLYLLDREKNRMQEIFDEFSTMRKEDEE